MVAALYDTREQRRRQLIEVGSGKAHEQERVLIMKILYIDIDSLRPDHLGCYGYPRATSPTIDRLASEGTRFENVMTSDSPCLPSRT
ncbi:MAG: sulfatase-like hydrolase/transferase, partial [Acetobacteraceae bacterium]